MDEKLTAFVFKTRVDVANEFPDAQQFKDFFNMVFEYQFEWKEPENVDPIMKAFFQQIKRSIDKRNARNQKISKSMKWNQNAVKNFENISKQMKTDENSWQQIKQKNKNKNKSKNNIDIYKQENNINEEKEKKENLIKEKKEITLKKNLNEYSFVNRFIDPSNPSIAYQLKKDKDYLLKQYAEIDKLNKDWYDNATIQIVLEYIKQDEFRSKNILSIRKLREKDKNWIPYIVRMIEKIKINENILDDPKYDLIFSVEEVNRLTLEGTPFRDAYKQVGLEVKDGTFKKDENLSPLLHTHEGSVGNLSTEKIKNKMESNSRF